LQEKFSLLSEYFSIEDYHARLRAGNITCREVVQQYLQRINETKN
jgi:Asp-tRNA(Asn)/Glu-tRNA(Gln) amidotransferase A subunit family amidase